MPQLQGAPGDPDGAVYAEGGYDPQELNNVYDDPNYAEIRDRMAMQMLDWYVHTADTVPVGEDPRGLPHRG